MPTYMIHTGTQGVEIDVGKREAKVRIPRMESEACYFLLEDRLEEEMSRHPLTDWVMDLSEHPEGITLVLAGVLSGLGDEARRQGCSMRCTGLTKTAEHCGKNCREERCPARST